VCRDAVLDGLGLGDEIKFNEFSRDGYDRVELPDFSFRIPNDPYRLQEALRLAFPEEHKPIDDLFEVLFAIHEEVEGNTFDAMRFLHDPFQFKNTVLYGPWPARRVFDTLICRRGFRPFWQGNVVTSA
jgi:hypothetical protein